MCKYIYCKNTNILCAKYKHSMCKKVQTLYVQNYKMLWSKVPTGTNILYSKVPVPVQTCCVQKYKHSMSKSTTITGKGTEVWTFYVQKYKHALCKSANIFSGKVKVFSILCAQKVKSVNILCEKIQSFYVLKYKRALCKNKNILAKVQTLNVHKYKLSMCKSTNIKCTKVQTFNVQNEKQKSTNIKCTKIQTYCVQKYYR